MSGDLNQQEQREQAAAVRAALEGVQTALEGGSLSDFFDVTYVLPAKDFGDGWTEVLEAHPTLRGVVKNVALYDVTEALNAVTTPARVDVGINSGDADAFSISAGIGAVSIGAAANPALTAGVTGTIPAGTDILVTGVAPTGGTPAGVATVAVTIRYFP